MSLIDLISAANAHDPARIYFARIEYFAYNGQISGPRYQLSFTTVNRMTWANVEGATAEECLEKFVSETTK